MAEMTSMDCAKLRTSRAAFLMILFCGFSCAWLQAQSDKAAGDLTFRSHTTVCDKPLSDNVLMIKNGKFRLETHVGSGDTAVDIYDCPGRRRIQVNDRDRTFLIRELGAPQLHQASLESETPEAEVTRILDLHDTGERKDFFGYSARHIKGTVSDQGESCAKDFRGKLYWDAWYIDPPVNGCFWGSLPKKLSYPSYGCKGRVKVKVTGIGDPGYPLLHLSSLDQHFSMVIRDEVTSVSHGPIDPALFKVPAGYMQVETLRELTGKEQAMVSAIDSLNKATAQAGSQPSPAPNVI